MKYFSNLFFLIFLFVEPPFCFCSQIFGKHIESEILLKSENISKSPLAAVAGIYERSAETQFDYGFSAGVCLNFLLFFLK